MRNIFATGLFLLLVGCGEQELTGAWIQPIPGMPGQTQGFLLEKGGRAESINMHTLLYENWKKNGDVLTLEGKSIGNGQTIEFSEEYRIEKVTAEELVLKKGENKSIFFRHQEY